MYETYFNLDERPFASVPLVRHYFPAATIESARTTLVRCIDRGEGAAVVIGASGTGKTLLCEVLAEHFKRSFQVALVAGGHFSTRRGILQAILYELGQSYRGMDDGELRLALVDHMTLNEECGRGVVLLVDEAHHLPLRLLDEVRTLTNLVRQGELAVRLVLAGNRALEERFAHPKLESFSQRLVARCYLEAFERSETQEYVHARIAACGGRGPQIFSPEACQSVHKATEGVPRLVNQVCDHVMLLAYAAGQRRIEPAHVEEAWADLQQLPTPWNEPAPDSAQGVIEFGGLDDEPGEKEPAGRAAEEDAGTRRLRISPDSGETEGQDIEPAEQVQHIQEVLANVEDEFRPAGAIGPEIELVFDEPGHPFREEFAEEEVIADRYAPARETPPPVEVADTASPPAAAVEVPGAEQPEPQIAAASRRGDRRPGRPVEPDSADAAATGKDGLDDAMPWPARVVAAIERQRYGRLFATLRGGSG